MEARGCVYEALSYKQPIKLPFGWYLEKIVGLREDPIGENPMTDLTSWLPRSVS